MTFGYSLSSREVVVMRQLRSWKRLWQRSLTCSYKRTFMGPSRSCWNGTTSALQLEEITSKGTRVSCVPIRRKSGNLFNDPRIYIYIYSWPDLMIAIFSLYETYRNAGAKPSNWYVAHTCFWFYLAMPVCVVYFFCFFPNLFLKKLFTHYIYIYI